MKKIEKSIKLGGKQLTLSSGYLAGQADSAVMASYGETVVLATVVASPLKEDLGYLPLRVDYMERLYAGGRIKGSRWVKREGRPLDDEILTARLIDRSIRPLFPKGYEKDIQVVVTVLSVDLENSPSLVASYAVSAAIAASSIPWQGPVAFIKVGRQGKTLITNPINSQQESSDLELIVSSTEDAIVMIEAGSKEVSEKEMLSAISHAQKEAGKVNKLINDFVKVVGVKKEIFEKEKTDVSLESKVKKLAGAKVNDLIKNMATKKATYTDYNEVKNAVIDAFEDVERKKVVDIFEKLFSESIRKILLSGKRPDGRKKDQVRELTTEVGLLPRTHGSAVFNRGQTQALSVTTLGAPSLEQFIESVEGQETKRYIHHYSMPPYSVGETGRVGFPSRREIGHGALAEKALLPVIPSGDDFPYTIRVVTEVLSSNGSTSMAAVCGSTLSLMDAGVPIKAPVAGIAVGLVVEGKKVVVLTDIIGIEDGSGDMDFKIAGTASGITALQMDVKTLKLTLPILKKALEQAKKARLEILKVIEKTISSPREGVSKYAPKIKVIKVPQDKIGEVIGPGGRVIKAIIAETGAQVDVEDDGRVNISGTTIEEVQNAFAKIEALVKEVEPGEIYEGEVKRIESYGAFVEVLPGKEGLVHISDMSEEFVQDPKELVKLGDKIQVRVKEVDDLGRINLSMLLKGDKKRPRQGNQQRRRTMNPQRNSQERFSRGRRRTFSRGRSRDKDRSSGPHFPASRLLEQNKKNFSR